MHSKTLANPGPLGLMGFGMTTILLNLHNAGFFPLTAVIVSMGNLKKGIRSARPHSLLMAHSG